MFTLNKKFLLIVRFLMTLTVTILTTGCANRPESIASSYISHERYIDSSCVTLTAQLEDAKDSLIKF